MLIHHIPKSSIKTIILQSIHEMLTVIVYVLKIQDLHHNCPSHNSLQPAVQRGGECGGRFASPGRRVHQVTSPFRRVIRLHTADDSGSQGGHLSVDHAPGQSSPQ